MTHYDLLFRPLHRVFHFELDPCTSQSNPLRMPHSFTIKEDGLKQEWRWNAFVNPTFSRPKRDKKEQRMNVKVDPRIRPAYDWMKYALGQSQKYRTTNLVVTPARTETKMMQDIAFVSAKAVCFVRKRMPFVNPNNGKGDGNSTFPTMLTVFSPRSLDKEQVMTLRSFGHTLLQ